MAVLQTIRVKFGLGISIIIALALLYFIIDPSTIQSASQATSSKFDVGKINGKSISFNDFQEDVEKYTRLNEIMTGSSVQDEESQIQVRDAAWQALLDKYMFVKAAKAAGFKVGDDEMMELLTGDMVSPVVAQSFYDESGNYDPQALIDFVRNRESDASGSLQLYWNYLQNTVYTQQMYNKYGSLFTQSSFSNPLMLKNAIEENNVATDVNFIAVPFGFSFDSTIVVSNNEIKEFYKNHKSFFKQGASRDIEYIVYEVIPSDADVAATNDKIASIYDEFSTTDNMKSFLLGNSDRQYSEYWYKEGELNTISAQINDFAFSQEKNAPTVSGIINEGNTFYGARIMETGMVPDSAYVKHILLQGADAKKTADSLLGVVKANPSRFAELAALYSADNSSTDEGEAGNIGWMTQTYMIPGMESVITAEVGKPYVIDTQYGSHVVLVSKKSKPVLKKQIAVLEIETVASQETFNEYYSKANKFASLAAGSYENYRKAVDTLGVYSHVLNNVTEATSSYGSIDNAKEVTRWIFNAKKGKVSDIITVNNSFFFVATLKGIHKEGIATVQEAASAIRETLYSQKAAEKAKENIASKIEGLTTLDQIAEALGTSVSSQSGLTFANLTSRGLDPAFIGALSVAPENKVVGPVLGDIAVYIFEVTGRETGSYYTEDDAKMYAAQMLQYKTQMIVPAMMEQADVKDNRARFY